MTDYRHLYLHVPFCGRRCSYCDFAIAVRREVPVSEYNDAIMAELVTRRIAPPSGPIKTLYLGGGTPSKLGGTGVEQLIHSLANWASGGELSTFPRDAEITLEANPEDVSAEAAARWVAAGVNRVSLGVQSFDPAVLEWMHRGHGPEAAAEAVRTLRESGISRISVDLIFAVPEHLNRSWTRDIEQALELDVSHLSVYGLTVEEHTPLGRWTRRGEVAEAPEERYEREFLEAHERLTAAGYAHYEVSNYARPGQASRHNSAYWEEVPYLGLGPSAHGFDGRERRWNVAAYAEWLRRIAAGQDPAEGSETVRVGAASAGRSEVAAASGASGGSADASAGASGGSADASAGASAFESADASNSPAIAESAERVYLGLRTSRGMDIRENERKTVTSWVEQGWAELEGNRVRLTATGWLRLDALAAQLIGA